MKRVLCATAVLSVMLISTPTFAQVFYEYPDAKVLRLGQSAAGPYMAFGDNDLVRVAGFGRVGFADYLDVGLEVLGDYLDGDWWAGIGGDAKLQVFPENPAIPFDLSLEAGIGYRGGNDNRVLRIPLGAAISSPFSNDSGALLTPYLGVYLLIIDTEYSSTVSDTDVDVELRGGVRYVRPSGLDLFATLQIGYQALFAVGTVFSFGKKDEG